MESALKLSPTLLYRDSYISTLMFTGHDPPGGRNRLSAYSFGAACEGIHGSALLDSVKPEEVEEVIMSSGLVAECAVLGIPDTSIGERVHAVCVPLDGSSPDVAEILEHCSRELPRHMLPRDVEFLDGLPRSPNGKVDYKRLKADRSPTEAGAS